ncbi:hypothetical protein [Xanthomonas sp. XNM01]|uniref:hypothetical protein n=1 Tax=Xanthomonas sp. XNM01 TaxID=2769289 RepID=UPI001785CE4B|nr:hypothetical protein [Xanthomonas sp. XNM01]MBD9369665.1 hypothetical protein [Xanthomonas sp. XNM01]
MRCLALLLLLSAPVVACAGPGDADPAPKRGACNYVPAANGDDVTVAAPQARAPIPAASRSVGKPASGNGNAGGGDADIALPRTRAAKWHSFLPGMFR